jgi:hypothetical protein
LIVRKGIKREIDNKRYYSYDIDGVSGRAFHIKKSTGNPEIHIDTRDRRFQVIKTKDEIILVFGHRKRKQKGVIFSV